MRDASSDRAFGSRTDLLYCPTDERDNINDISPDDLSKTIAQANLLFKAGSSSLSARAPSSPALTPSLFYVSKVQAPSEAILDSRILVAASGAGALKARQMKLDANAFDSTEFLNKLIWFMGGRLGGAGKGKGKGKKRAVRDEEEEESEEEDGEGQAEGGLKWERLGRALAGESRRPPTMDFMYVSPLFRALTPNRADRWTTAA